MSERKEERKVRRKGGTEEERNEQKQENHTYLAQRLEECPRGDAVCGFCHGGVEGMEIMREGGGCCC
jgi:hypothetical protein